MSILLLAIVTSSFGQKLATRNGYVKFFSAAALENIEAENNLVSSVLDLGTGNFAFLVKIKSFQFEKALMQEHFNENYLMSDEFPKATFKGAIENFEKLDFTKDGTFEATFKGTMKIKGTEKEISEPATVTVKDGVVSLNSEFSVKASDYGVKIPAAKKDNISENLKITVKITYAKK